MASSVHDNKKHQQNKNTRKNSTRWSGKDHSPWLLPVPLTVPGGPDRYDSSSDPAEPVLAPGGGPRSRHLSPSRLHPSPCRPLCADHSGPVPGPASVAANALLPMYTHVYNNIMWTGILVGQILFVCPPLSYYGSLHTLMIMVSCREIWTLPNCYIILYSGVQGFACRLAQRSRAKR